MTERRSEVRIRCSAPELVAVSELVDWLRHPRSGSPPRHPLSVVRAALALLRSAPTLTVQAGESVQGRRIVEYLTERRWGMRRRLWAKSALFIPPAGRSPFAGKSMQAVRTNMRRCTEQGLSCREVHGVAVAPGQRTFRLVDADGAEIGTIGITIDGAWALIEYLVSDDPQGFYLLHGHVVEECQRLGVGHLIINAENAPLLAPGLLYMQARLGYEVVNLRLAD